MIVETPLDFDWDTALARLGTLPRQAEWEAYMVMFQVCKEKAKCPGVVKNVGVHTAMCYYENGTFYWDYQAVKAALEQ